MKEIIYESEMFAEDSTGAVFPFKIVVESELVNDIKKITVYKKEFMGIGNGKTEEKNTILNSTFWKIELINNIFKQNGYICQKKNVHIVEYRKDNVTVYNAPGKKANIIVNPENEKTIKKGNIEYKMYHNSNMNSFPKRNNNGETDIHYGLKIDFDDEKKLDDFLKKFHETLL